MENQRVRKNIRLAGYDYASSGAYFVTICTKNREDLFGEIKNGEMVLNAIGKIVNKWWKKLPTKFENIRIDECCIMPNHFHGIVWTVGVDPCVDPVPVCDDTNRETGTLGQGGHTGPPLPRIVQWFKSMSTNEYFRYKNQDNLSYGSVLWQRNYYERIIRNDTELSTVRKYIAENPLKWELDPDRNPISPTDVSPSLPSRPPHTRTVP